MGAVGGEPNPQVFINEQSMSFGELKEKQDPSGKIGFEMEVKTAEGHTFSVTIHNISDKDKAEDLLKLSAQKAVQLAIVHGVGDPASTTSSIKLTLSNKHQFENLSMQKDNGQKKNLGKISDTTLSNRMETIRKKKETYSSIHNLLSNDEQLAVLLATKERGPIDQESIRNIKTLKSFVQDETKLAILDDLLNNKNPLEVAAAKAAKWAEKERYAQTASAINDLSVKTLPQEEKISNKAPIPPNKPLPSVPPEKVIKSIHTMKDTAPLQKLSGEDFNTLIRFLQELKDDGIDRVLNRIDFSSIQHDSTEVKEQLTMLAAAIANYKKEQNA